jgi:hypothetical protein
MRRGGCADTQDVLKAVRDSLQLNFGDHGLGQEYGSLQGTHLPTPEAQM